jgi:hypothetical protein
MNIELHIERLVLEGIRLRPGDHHRLQAGVEAELVRLLTERGIPGGGHPNRGLARFVTPAIELESPPDANALGTRIGGRVYSAVAASDQGTRHDIRNAFTTDR